MMDEKKKLKLNETGFIIAVLAFPLTLFLVFYVYVNASSFAMAFQYVDSNFNYHWNGLKNFVEIFKTISDGGALLSTAFKNNLLIFFWTLIIGFPLNMLFSYYLYKGYFGNQIIRFIVMMPSILSGMVMSLLFLKFVETSLPDMLSRLLGIKIGNLLNSEAALTTIIFYMMWTGFTTSLILYPNAMNAIDDGIIESAQLDGVNVMQELLYIIIPLIYPTITTFFVTGTASLFTNAGPLFAFYYNDAPADVWTMGYYLYVKTMFGSGQTAYPFMSALGLVLTLITVPTVMFVKWLMEKFDPLTD